MFKLYIFDLDGVLVDTCDIHYRCLNDAISQIVGKDFIINKYDHDKLYNGLSTKVKLQMMTNIDKNLHPAIYKLKQDLTYSEMYKLEKCERLIEMIKILKQNGALVACASNCIRKTVEVTLESLGIFQLFDFVFSNEDVIRSKPFPDIYLECMKNANIMPDDTLIFEDSYVGLEAAILSGANVHFVSNVNSLNSSYIMDATANIMNNVNVVIPMAGNGSRFANAGYKDPKPFIPVFGSPMISWVVKNIGINAKYTFVIRKEFEETHGAREYLNSIAPGCNIVTVDKVTEGAACTVLLTQNYIDNDNPLIIINSDQYIEFEHSRNAFDFVFDFLHKPSELQLSGKISTFDGGGNPKWSYAKTDNNGLITEVREKDPFSEHATTGLYMWRHGSDFVKYANQMISKNIRVNNEFYVVPVFNEAILDGLKFSVSKCKKMWGIGVPEDLNVFLNEYPLKIAICYSGEPRDIAKCFENHKKNIFQHHHVEIYAHIWEVNTTDTSATPYELGTDNSWRKDIPLVSNLDYLSIIKPYKYIIEKRDMLPAYAGKRQEYMFHGIRKCIEMINKNIKYDCVIRLRPDFFVYDKIDFSKITDLSNSIWLTVNSPTTENFLWTPDDCRCTDFFALGANGDILLQFYNIITDTTLTHKTLPTERDMLFNKINICSLETHGHLYRNIYRDYPELFNNIDTSSKSNVQSNNIVKKKRFVWNMKN